MRKQLPPRDLVWIDAQGRPTEIFFDYIKNLEGRSLGHHVPVVTVPTNGQFLVFNVSTGGWDLQPATAATNGQVLIYSTGSNTWVPDTN